MQVHVQQIVENRCPLIESKFIQQQLGILTMCSPPVKTHLQNVRRMLEDFTQVPIPSSKYPHVHMLRDSMLHGVVILLICCEQYIVMARKNACSVKFIIF